MSDYKTKAAAAAAQGLMAYYKDCKDGLFEPEANWRSAIAFESIIDYMDLTGDHQYSNIIEEIYKDGPAYYYNQNFINIFYDDNSWWAISWMKAYDFCKKNNIGYPEKYLDISKAIFIELLTGWDDLCGGGLYWKKNPKIYKAAIQNELFLVVSTRLHLRVGSQDPQYMYWAKKVYDWFYSTPMIDHRNLVQNGLDKDHSCAVYREQDKAIHTYNQGVILGGLVELSKIESNPEYLVQAKKISDATIHFLTYQNGVLREPCELNPGNCNRNQKCFKGIFMRYFVDLYQSLPDSDPDKIKYKEFILLNANSVWEYAKDPNPTANTFSTKWVGPYEVSAVNNCTQMSALDALNAGIVAGV